MDEKISVSNCDSDSSDDLPDLADLFPERTFDIRKLKQNDIVWAEYKDLHWPALVRNVDTKNKKVNIWYADSPGKSFKLSFKKVHDFYDYEFELSVREKAKSHPLRKKHDDMFTRTRIFIDRRCRGIDDDPAQFFDLSKPYFVFKDYSPESLESKAKSDNIANEKTADENVALEENSDKSSAESDGEASSNAQYLPELCQKESHYDDEMVDKILSYIKTGHVDQYLLDIVNSKITSEKHESYVEAVRADKKELLWNSPPYIPISNKKLHNVLIYLHDLYKKSVEKKERAMNEYIILVWLPEAVDKAISLIEESSKLPVDLGSIVSFTDLKTEASESTVDSGINKISNTPHFVELSSLVDSNSSNPSFQERASECLVDSDSSNIFIQSQIGASELFMNTSKGDACSALKRKLSLDLSLVKNKNSGILDTEASTSNKKFSGRNKPKAQSKALKFAKKAAVWKMAECSEENIGHEVSNS